MDHGSAITQVDLAADLSGLVKSSQTDAGCSAEVVARYPTGPERKGHDVPQAHAEGHPKSELAPRPGARIVLAVFALAYLR